MGQSTATVSLRGITKVFSTDTMETHALRGVDLDIFPGDFISICGPSGCGKSTLLSLLGLLDMPSSGSYAIDGREVSKLSLSEAAVPGAIITNISALSSSRST